MDISKLGVCHFDILHKLPAFLAKKYPGRLVSRRGFFAVVLSPFGLPLPVLPVNIRVFNGLWEHKRPFAGFLIYSGFFLKNVEFMRVLSGFL